MSGNGKAAATANLGTGDGHVTDTHALEDARRMKRALTLIDRFFPLIWLGLYLLLPVSGWATVMFESWFDQQRDLEALRSVLATGRADAIADSTIGPAYIATAAFLHFVFGFSPEDSLVALTRASYALSVAAGMALVGVLVRRLTPGPAGVSLAAQFLFLTLVISAGTWYWSDVPWSHFFAAFLGAAFYTVRLVPARLAVAGAVLTGVVLALLFLTRSFEFVALVLAWGLVLALLAILGLSRPRSVRWTQLLAGAGAFLVTTAVVFVATGKRDWFFLYGSHLDNQSGDLPPTEIAQTPTFSPAFVPVKLVQLVLDPCFYSMCALSDYAGGAAPLPMSLEDSSGQERLWRLPLAIQLPSLVLLPLCVLAALGMVIWFTRNRAAAAERVRELRLLVEMTVAAAGIVVGYSASTLTGASHLRYGFARDFLLPALLSGIVAAGLATAGLWLVLPKASQIRVRPTNIRLSRESALIVIVVVAAMGLGTAVSIARADGLPRIESRHLGPITYTASCRDLVCDVEIEARTVSGRTISIPEPSTLTFGCGSNRPRLTLYTRKPSAGVRITGPCSDPRLVAAWPTVMGLPPDGAHLRVVGVANVNDVG